MQRLSAALRRGYSFKDAGEGVKDVLIGRDGWPFAVPLIQENKRWKFDTDSGIEEVQDRRVGRNELDAIATCHYCVAAQQLYFQMNPGHDTVPTYATHWPARPANGTGSTGRPRTAKCSRRSVRW